MQVVKNLPIVFLILLAGCAEQSTGTTRVTVPDPVPEPQLVDTQTPVDDQQGIGRHLYKVIKTVDATSGSDSGSISGSGSGSGSALKSRMESAGILNVTEPSPPNIDFRSTLNRRCFVLGGGTVEIIVCVRVSPG